MDKLDPQALNLAKAIKRTETGGSKDPYNQKGASGETGAYQFMPTTYKALAKQHLGNENAPMTIENQNKIAYSEIKRLKDLGKTPAEIASYWNSGKTDAYKNPKYQGVNSKGVKYDVPGYVAKVSATYNELSASEKKKIEPIINPQEQADIASQQKYGSTFGSKSGGTAAGEALRTVANIPKSAFNFVKGALDLINPVSTVNKIKEIVSGTKELAKEKGGFGKAIVATAKEAPKVTYETLVPEVARTLFKGDLEEAQRAIVNDPVGQILPFLLAAKGGASMADTAATKAAMADYVKNPYTTKTIPKPVTKYSNAVDTAVSKTASAVTKPIKSAFGKVGQARDYAIGQATGLNPETIKTIKETPKAFSKKGMADIDRNTIGRQVQSQLAKLAEEKSSTGKEYKPIRASKTPVKVDPTFWDNTFKETTGLEIKKGKLTPTTVSKIRDAGDVRALQKVYEFWKPKFKSGQLTAEEYLNAREDLANASKFEKDLGKRKGVEVLAGQIRAKLNQAYRPQIEGLAKLDETMTSQISEYKDLSKGIIDKNGTVTDAGLSKIANLSKNKPNLAIQLEKILPGITKQVKVLQAIADIERASGIKVGTYGRAALTGGAFLGGGPVSAIITAVLTSPEMAVPLLRQYGLLKNSTAVRAVANALRSSAKIVNQIPEKTPTVLKKDTRDIPMGMSIKDVSKTPQAFSPKAKGVVAPKETTISPTGKNYKVAKDWLYDWQNADAGGAVKIKNIPKEAETFLSQFKPKEPIKLYRGVRNNQTMANDTGIESWTHKKYIAKGFADNGKVIEKIIDPKDIIFDIKSMPASVRNDFISGIDSGLAEAEVLVRSQVKKSNFGK